MQEALASIDDLATWMRTTFEVGSDREDQAEFLLKLASAWARSYAQRVWPTVEDIPASKRHTVAGIILAACRRELLNPRRATYEVHGPDSASYNEAACPPGFFTEEEIGYLRRCSTTGTNWWVQKTYRDDPCETAGYLFATDFKAPIPMYAPYDTEGWLNSYHR